MGDIMEIVRPNFVNVRIHQPEASIPHLIYIDLESDIDRRAPRGTFEADPAAVDKGICIVRGE
jgi:hypothetical protein